MNKKFFLFVAAAAALVSCSDEMKFEQTESFAKVDGINGKLVQAGYLSASAVDEATRGFSAEGKFVWMAQSVDGAGVPAAYPEIGLCWTGVNPAEPEYGAADAAQENVFTNYLYQQVGWLEKGQVELDVDYCTNNVKQGAFYQGYPATPNATFAGSYAPGIRDVQYTQPSGTSTRWNKYFYGAQLGKYNDGGVHDLNLGAGVFSTENSSVFEGQYIAYFPYNPDFKKGPIIAKEPTSFSIDAADDVYKQMDLYGYQLGVIDQYAGVKGGSSKAAPFNSYNYSSFCVVNLFSDAATTPEFRSVVLYSAKEGGIIYENGLDAKKIVAAQGKLSAPADVAGDKYKKHIHAIYANLTDAAAGNDYIKVTGSSKHYSASTAVKVVLPVLPQTVEDLQVILVDKDYKAWTWKNGAKETVTFKPGQTTSLDVNVKGSMLAANDYLAYDEPSLAAVISKLYTSNIGGTIKMLRPIDLVSANDALYPVAQTMAFKGNVTIKADDATNCTLNGCVPAQLVVKSNTTRTIESYAADKTFKVEVPVIVEGVGCCATVPATLNLGGTEATANDIITFTKKLYNYGTTNVGNVTSLSTVTLADVDNTWDTEWVKKLDGSDKKGSYARKMTTGCAEMHFNAVGGDNQKTVVGNVLNDGKIDFTAAAALTVGDYEGNRANKITIKSIVNNGWKESGLSGNATSAAQIVGGSIEVNKYALVTVTDDILNSNEWAYVVTNVETVGSAHSATTDGRLDVYQTAKAAVNKGSIENYGVVNWLTKNMDNSNGLFIDRLNGQVGGKFVNNGADLTAAATDANYKTYYLRGVHVDANKYSTDIKNGIYVAEVGTEQRLALVMKDQVQSKSVVVIDIIDGSTYDLNAAVFTGAPANLKNLDAFDVRISKNACTIKNNTTSAGKYVGENHIGHCVFAQENLTLDQVNKFNVVNNVLVSNNKTLDATANAGLLNVGNNVYVYGANGKVSFVAAVPANFAAVPGLTVGNDLVNKGTTTLNAERVLDVKHDVLNSKNIVSDKQFLIGHNYEGYAGSDLDSNGTLNVVENNFNLSGNAEFKENTTTNIKNTFNSQNTNSVFTREELAGLPLSRATVNCKVLGQTAGHAVGGWPTEYGE